MIEIFVVLNVPWRDWLEFLRPFIEKNCWHNCVTLHSNYLGIYIRGDETWDSHYDFSLNVWRESNGDVGHQGYVTLEKSWWNHIGKVLSKDFQGKEKARYPIFLEKCQTHHNSCIPIMDTVYIINYHKMIQTQKNGHPLKQELIERMSEYLIKHTLLTRASIKIPKNSIFVRSTSSPSQTTFTFTFLLTNGSNIRE